MSFPTVLGRAVEGLLMREARSDLGPTWSLSIYKFFLTGTSTPANVYQDGALTTPFAPTGVVTADAFGRFPAIYLDPSVIYRVQFFNSVPVQQWQVDPYTSTLSTVGTSSLSAFGPKIATTGEITIPAPNTGGSGISLILKAGALGSAPLQINGIVPGNSAIIINSSAGTGAQTAVFQANNKPGTPPTTFALTLTVAPPNGAGYVGGTLTAPFTGPTASNYTVVTSTGQSIFGATLTNNSTAFVVPSTTITGGPTANISVQTPVVPAGWLPITCDGVQYYTPIWHGNNFSPYVSNPQAQGEAISASSVTFGGNGITTASGGTALPGNWFVPSSASVGAGYWINITKNGGLSGISFNVASNVSATAAPSGATYTGGTLTANFTGNTASNYVLLLSTGQSISGCTFTNGSTTFTCPSTNISGTPSAILQVSIQGVWENITSSGLTISTNAAASISGTYQLSTSVTGSPVVASGTITLSGNNGVTSNSWNGTTPLVLGSDGQVTLNTVLTSPWYFPTTGGISTGMYIKITQTGGTPGYSFSAGAGAWTSITGGLTIALSGSGFAGVPNVTGTYILASDSGGVNQLGTGTITISGSVTHTYTSGTNATETVPAGASFLEIIVDGGGGSGSSDYSGHNPTYSTGGGGSGEAHSRGIAVSAGQTLTYTVGKGGTGVNGSGMSSVNGNAGGASTVTGNGGLSGISMSAGGGGAAINNGAPGAGGTASGGNYVNTNGNAGYNYTGTSEGGNSAAGASGGFFNSAPGTPGAGSGGASSSATYAGGVGQVQFIYT